MSVPRKQHVTCFGSAMDRHNDRQMDALLYRETDGMTDNGDVIPLGQPAHVDDT